MENSGLIILDTNILIEFYKGNEQIRDAILNIGKLNIAISDVTISELYIGAKNKVELIQLKSKLESIYIININEQISEQAVKLIYDYSLSHNLKLPDALIAATSIYYNLPLFTLNKKDFKYLDLKLYE
jgi:tRNA(fMet)-specific endonuclease VapC